MAESNKQNNTTRPLVSVVMCTYNGEKYLRAQIGSILAQTYQNIELIIADDASTDSTASILEEYRQKDPRVKYVINAINKGYNKNFEYAFSLAAAEYIAISDQDDIWELHKIETIMNNWLPGSLLMYSLSGTFRENDLQKKSPPPDVHYAHISHMHSHVFGGPIHGHACMLKKELITYSTPFPPDIFYDAWIAMHAISRGVVGYVPHILTWHRVHEKNSSRTIMSLKDNQERNKKLREQSVYFLETFCNLGIGNKEQTYSLLEYASLLKKMDGEKFYWPMFKYVMKNRKLIFHYKKKKPFIFISYLKHSLRMAKRGLL